MKKSVLLFLVFGCVGTTTEVFFTAFGKLFSAYASQGAIDLSLVGASYAWMFPIYGLAALLFPVVYRQVKKYHLAGRLVLYAIVIFVVEFVAGFLLEVTTGHCPWEYKSRWAVFGYIRLDYVFFWMGFGFVVERVYLFFSGMFDAAVRRERPT